MQLSLPPQQQMLQEWKRFRSLGGRTSEEKGKKQLYKGEGCHKRVEHGKDVTTEWTVCGRSVLSLE